MLNKFCLSHPIILQFCTEHGSITAMLCAKLQNDWAMKKNKDKQDFMDVSAVLNAFMVCNTLCQEQTQSSSMAWDIFKHISL